MLLLASAMSMSACEDAAKPPSGSRASAAAPALRAATPVAWKDTDPPEVADPRKFLDRRPMRWADWETRPPADRFARLRELGITPIRRDTLTPRAEYEYGAEPDGERAEDYHFADFSGDGVADVIYAGTTFGIHEGRVGTAEAAHIKLYQVMGGRAVQVAEHHGTLERIWKGRPGEPVSLLVEHGEHCMDDEWSLAFLRPVRTRGRVGYEPYRYVVGTAEIQLPKRYTGSPRRFTVSRDGYLLRSRPEIDTASYGNQIAVYPRGARGTAHAERRDATGRVWWFVKMDGRTPPTTGRPREEDPSSPIPTDRIGWMSSRFLSPAP
ncbi:MAG TPA: hypothetical protein VF584_19275 [Longimicrobium sp.]|jgi:hypothetical protein